MSLSASSTLPRALVSAQALRAGAEAAVAAGGTIADLRADAWGHGVLETAHIAVDAGLRTVLVDSVDLDALRARGIDATDAGESDTDPAMLYGLLDADAVPAMSLVGTVMSVKPLRPGEAVSYGYRFRTPVPTTVALVTGGYSQAIVRALGDQVDVEIAGRLHPIVGRVAMDVCVVDAQDEPVEEGSVVTFFGGTGPARDQLVQWAHATGLTAAELVTAVGLHAVREHVA